MAKGNKRFWKDKWNQHALDDAMYGRDSWRFSDFCLLLQDIIRAVGVSQTDTVLEAGGGTGAIAMVLSPFVKRITLFDIGGEVVAKARQNTKGFGNIEVLEDDVAELRHIEGSCSRVIVGSVIQYLNLYDELAKTLSQIYRCLEIDGKALFTHNPDLSKKEAHFASYGRLQWDAARIRAALDIEERRFWIDKERLSALALDIGFRASYETPIHPDLWQSTHMFDWVLVKHRTRYL